MATGLRKFGKRALLRTPVLRDVVVERDRLRWEVDRLQSQLRAARGEDDTLPPPERRDQWFWDHYRKAVGELLDFVGGDGVVLTGRRVADVGCGDGILDLGLMHRARPAALVAFDVNATNVDHLRRVAASQGVDDVLPEGLEFRRCQPCRLPADDASFDFVFSWSAFEHVAEPEPVLREMRRVLRPDGAVFMTLWPFYHSAHGSHLWNWFPDGYAQLLHSVEEIEAVVRAHPRSREWNGEYLLSEFKTLNRITFDELHRAIRTAGFRVTKLEVLGQPCHVPAALADLPPSLIGVSGMRLLAVPH